MNKKIVVITVFAIVFLIGGLYIFEHISLNKYQKGLLNSDSSPIDISNSEDVQGIKPSDVTGGLEKD